MARRLSYRRTCPGIYRWAPAMARRSGRRRTRLRGWRRARRLGGWRALRLGPLEARRQPFVGRIAGQRALDSGGCIRGGGGVTRYRRGLPRARWTVRRSGPGKHTPPPPSRRTGCQVLHGERLDGGSDCGRNSTIGVADDIPLRPNILIDLVFVVDF